MEAFEISAGPSQRRLRIEPQANPAVYQVYAVDVYEDWIDHEQSRLVDVPEDGLLGTITVRSERDFDFEGAGAFTGDDVLSIAAQIVRHPNYQQQ